MSDNDHGNKGIRDAVKNCLGDLRRRKKHFAKKTLAEMKWGVPPPPLWRKIAEIFLKKIGSKRAEISVFWPKIAVFSGFFP